MAVGFLFLKNQTAAKPRNFWVDTALEIGCFALVVGWVVLLRHFNVVPRLARFSWSGQTLAEWFRVSTCVWTFAILIYVFARSRGVLARFVSWRPMVFLGEVSFAFYMIHYLVIMFVKQNFWSDTSLSPVALIACTFFVTLALSVLLYKLVEMPAKTALHSLYRLDFRGFLTALPDDLGRFGRTGTAWLTVAMLGIPVWVINQDVLENQRSNQKRAGSVVQQILDDTAPFHKNIRFEDKVQLLGCRAVPKAMGIELEMVWKKRADLERNRFIQVLDETGEVVAFGARNPQIFETTPSGEAFIDRVFIKNESLKKGVMIVTGFHGQGIGMLKANKGPRSRGNRRLHVVTTEQFEQLLDGQTERFAKNAEVKTSRVQ